MLLYLEDISVQLSYINISYMIDFYNRKKRLYSTVIASMEKKKKNQWNQNEQEILSELQLILLKSYGY